VKEQIKLPEIKWTLEKVQETDWSQYEDKVEKWISWNWEDEPPYSVSISRGGGFFGDGTRWEDYINRIPEEKHKYIEALRSEILRRNLKQGGDWHQGKKTKGVPVFSDGTIAIFSFRGFLYGLHYGKV